MPFFNPKIFSHEVVKFHGWNGVLDKKCKIINCKINAMIDWQLLFVYFYECNVNSRFTSKRKKKEKAKNLIRVFIMTKMIASDCFEL